MPRLTHYTLRHATLDPITGGTVSELFGRHYWHRFDARGDSEAIEVARAFINRADPARLQAADFWELSNRPKSKRVARPVATFVNAAGVDGAPGGWNALRAPTCEVR